MQESMDRYHNWTSSSFENIKKIFEVWLHDEKSFKDKMHTSMKINHEIDKESPIKSSIQSLPLVFASMELSGISYKIWVLILE